MEFQYGHIVSQLPEGLVPKELWPEYDRKSTMLPFCSPHDVGTNPKGIRWSLWPLCFEVYMSDTMPDMTGIETSPTTARNRLVMWNRIQNISPTPGWRMLSKRPAIIEGYTALVPEYWHQWSESARRARKKWLTDFAEKKYQVRFGSFTEFERGYNKSTVARSTMRESIRITRQIEEKTPQIMKYIVAESMADGTIKAGISIIESNSTKNSYYAAGFYHKDVQHEPLMVGLMDEWFRTSLERGYRYLHLGQFWYKGETRSWKGFSNFKSKFGLFYYAFPPTLWRFVPGKLY